MKNPSAFLSIILLSLLFSSSINAQEEPLQKGLDAITKESVQAQLEFLSSDWMEGRGTGEKGEFLAADYLASMLQFMGIEGAGDEEWTRPSREQRWSGIRSEKYTSYFQNIYLTRYLESATQLSILFENTSKEISFNEQTDFSVYDYPMNIKITSSLVFVGYGFVDEASGYDDFKGIDVKDKIIVRLSGYPGHLDTTSVGYQKFHKEERYFEYYMRRDKNKTALKKGAAAVIEISNEDYSKYWANKNEFEKISVNENPRSPIYEHNLELPTDTIKDALLQIYPTKKLVNKLLENQNINVEYIEKQIASNLKPQSKILKGTKINITYNVKTDIIQARNVLGVIEGENKNDIVIIGGHYDHLGAIDGFVWNGADDNASGTVGVWMLAKAFATSGIKPKKTIVFAAWTGEEIGLFGSEYFADHPYGGSIENIKFYLNFDMISKDSEKDTLKNQARMVYTSTYTELEDITEKNIADYNLNLDITYKPSEKPRGGSDHASFAAKNVPVMYFMAGFPTTFHTPKDQTYDVNWGKMVDIIKLSYLNLWEIVNEE
ncbi:M20/M25/M40 family metallo-hydrolase [Bacteroidota bacterium]